MSTSTAHVPTNVPQSAAADKNLELLNAQQCATRANINVASWHRLVKANKAPQPVPGSRWRWNPIEVAQWVEQARNAPTIADVEDRVPVSKSGVSKETVRDALARGLLSEGDVETIRVRVERRGSPIVRPVKFIRTAAAAILRAVGTGNRHFAQRERWASFETIREGDDMLLSLRAALRRMKLSKRQFYRICESEGFRVSWRDKRGRHVLPPPKGTQANAGDGAFEYYLLSELEAYDNSRNALKFTVTVEKDGAYSLEETSRLTGLPYCRLKSTEIAKALGLLRVKRRVRSACKRKKGKRGKDEWNRSREKVGFTKRSVDAYLEKHPKLTELCVPADEVKAEDAAETLKMDVTTVVQWWHAGLLEGEKRKYWTDAGVREGVCLKTASVATAKSMLNRVDGSVRSARRLLVASHEKAFWNDHKNWLTGFEVLSKHGLDANQLWKLCQRDWPEMPTGKIRVEQLPKRATSASGKKSASSTPLFHPDDIAHAAAAPDGRTKEWRALKAKKSATGTSDTSYGSGSAAAGQAAADGGNINSTTGAPASHAAKSTRPRGRPASDDVAKKNRLCYEAYLRVVKKETKSSQEMQHLTTELGELDAPKEWSHVRANARRHAKKIGKPLPEPNK